MIRAAHPESLHNTVFVVLRIKTENAAARDRSICIAIRESTPNDSILAPIGG
jgi:hypothetical protein